MKLTKHASIRQQQRSISNLSLEIIKDHGRVLNAPGGAEKIFFGNRERDIIVSQLKKTIQLVERAKGGSIIVADGKVLTLYKF